MEKPDEALAKEAAKGNRQAVEALLERHLPGVHAYLRLHAGPMIRARESTSDLVQSVCRDVLAHLDRFQHPGEGAFKQWLYTQALRKILDRRKYYLAQRRDALRERRPRAGDSENLSELFACYQTLSTPSRKVASMEELARIEEAFDRLSDTEREIITLAKVVGLSRAEIAERLGKNEGAVRVQLYRALLSLSELLDTETPETSR